MLAKKPKGIKYSLSTDCLANSTWAEICWINLCSVNCSPSCGGGMDGPTEN